MILRIAIRNLFLHKSKTIISGTLICLGIIMTLVFNSLINSFVDTISQSFIKNYTGDILITTSDTTGAGIFGTQSEDIMGPPVIPLLKDYEKVIAVLNQFEGIKSYTSQMSLYTLINFEEKGMDYSLFFGIDPADYFNTMNGAKIIDGMGRRLKPGEEGVMLHYTTWKRIKNEREIELKAGDQIQLNSFGSVGLKIREVPVVGIFKFDSNNDRLYVPSFIDIKTLRYMAGRYGGIAEKVDVSNEAVALLDSDINTLFEEESIVKVDSSPQFDPDTLQNAMDEKPAPSPDTGSWNFILVRLKDNRSARPLIDSLNKIFTNEDIHARAQGWMVSAAPDSLIYDGIRIVLNIFIIILSIVATIIIMNTLVVSVMTRTVEIGTMRAIGAQKSFIMRMFITETSLITLIFGALGFLIGFVILSVFYFIGIPTDNNCLRFFGGGLTIKPFISLGPVILSVLLMAAIGLLSWIFPVFMALKITPLKAISME
jgi:putative ABC transport system permease protein